MTAQPRRMSLIEAITNVAVGYALAVGTQIAVFPWFGLHPSFGQNLTIGAFFVGISLIRSYALRRLFEHCKHGPTDREAKIQMCSGSSHDTEPHVSSFRHAGPIDRDAGP
jgi:hypothetical protein